MFNRRHSAALGRRLLDTLRDQPLGRQLKAANRAGARAALILGPEEAERGDVTVRDLRTGEQAKRTVDQLLLSTDRFGGRRGVVRRHPRRRLVTCLLRNRLL